ncbi:uncharacterized protein BDZ83DRAFT_774961 [Colletotrichum acutatum]|uniref:Uncharacterized protein n=1 Tax=Glomerella acutata TaxID=27357 RepID=A0AAD8XH82_GLOAC|nr:uncharacterized protein BDZ83DRAFT_774961 [Colletotrichum acutatum]KAK1726196.1 hypothetical protein BDZ83DRAFT_774961 [Colletotrichum acutatum]
MTPWAGRLIRPPEIGPDGIMDEVCSEGDGWPDGQMNGTYPYCVSKQLMEGQRSQVPSLTRQERPVGGRSPSSADLARRASSRQQTCRAAGGAPARCIRKAQKPDFGWQMVDKHLRNVPCVPSAAAPLLPYEGKSKSQEPRGAENMEPRCLSMRTPREGALSLAALLPLIGQSSAPTRRASWGSLSNIPARSPRLQQTIANPGP